MQSPVIFLYFGLFVLLIGGFICLSSIIYIDKNKDKSIKIFFYGIFVMILGSIIEIVTVISMIGG